MIPSPVLWTLGILIVLLILGRALLILFMCLGLKNTRIGPDQIEQINPRDIQNYLHPLFEEGRAALSPLGFTYLCTLRDRIEINGNLTTQIYQIYIHSMLPVWASISPALTPEKQRAFDVIFYTAFSDHTLLRTTDCIGHLLPTEPPRIQRNDVYLNQLSEQWQSHLQAISTSGREPMQSTTSAENALEETRRLAEEQRTYQLREKILIPTPEENICQISFSGAWKLAKQMKGGLRKYAEARRKPSSQTSNRNAQIAAHHLAFERLKAREGKKTQGWVTKVILFLSSVLLFAVLFKFKMSWTFILALVVVLLIHESGHYLAMKWFGYKKCQIIFIPFLGAAVIGEKEKATPIQKFIVYLSGPLPGLLLGMALLYIGDTNSFYHEFAFIAVILNVINLFPVFPLDGGRIVQLLFLHRFPRVQFFFVLLSCLILGIPGLLLSDIPLLFIAGLLAFNLPNQWRWGSLAGKLKQVVPRDADSTLQLHSISYALTEPPFDRLPFSNKFQISKRLLQYLASPVPKIATMILCSIIYIMALFSAPAFGFFKLIHEAGFDDLSQMRDSNYVFKHAKQEPDWPSQLQHAKRLGKRWRIYIRAAEWNRYFGNHEAARQYSQLAMDISTNFPSDDSRRKRALLMAAQTAETEKEALEIFDRYIHFMENKYGTDEPQTAEALEKIITIPPLYWESPEQCIPYMERAISIHSHDKENRFDFLHARQLLASLYYHSGHSDKAIAVLEEIIDLPPDNNDLYVFTKISAIDNLTEIYFDQKEIEKTLPLIEKQIELKRHCFTNSPAFSDKVVSSVNKLGWMYIHLNDYPQALEKFEEAEKYCLSNEIQSFECAQNLLDLCWIQLQKGQEEKARKIWGEYQRHAPAYMKDYANSLNAQHAEIKPTWLTKRSEAHREVFQRMMPTPSLEEKEKDLTRD